MGGPRRGHERRGVEPGKHTLGLVEAPDREFVHSRMAAPNVVARASAEYPYKKDEPARPRSAMQFALACTWQREVHPYTVGNAADQQKFRESVNPTGAVAGLHPVTTETQ